MFEWYSYATDDLKDIVRKPYAHVYPPYLIVLIDFCSNINRNANSKQI